MPLESVYHQFPLGAAPDVIEGYIFENPCLLGQKAFEGLANHLSEFAAIFGEGNTIWTEGVENSLAQIIRLGRRLMGDGYKQFPLGRGPIDSVWKRLIQGEIAWENAVKLIQKLDTEEHVSPLYIDVICFNGADIGRQGEKNGVWLLKLVLALLERIPISVSRDRMWMAAILSYLDAAAGVLQKVPDGRIFTEVVQKAAELEADVAAQQGKPDPKYSIEQQWSYFHRLAVLYHDPYFGARSLDGYNGEYSNWQIQLDIALVNKFSTEERKEFRMPPVASVVESGKSYARKAMEFNLPLEKAKSIKLFVALCLASIALRLPVDEMELLSSVDLGLQIAPIGPEGFELRSFFEATRSGLQRRQEGKMVFADQTEILEWLLSHSTPEAVVLFGRPELMNILCHVGGSITREEEKVLKVVKSHQSIYFDAGNEVDIQRYFKVIVKLLINVYREEQRFNQADEYIQYLDAVSKEVNGDRSFDRNEVFSFLALVMASVDLNAEEKALDFLDNVLNRLAIHFAGYEREVAYIQAILTSNIAVNWFNQQDATLSFDWYLRSAEAHLSVGLLARADEMVVKAEDSLVKWESRGVRFEEAIAALTRSTLPIERLLGDSAMLVIRRICFRLICKQTVDDPVGGNLSQLFELSQVSKGRQFAVRLRHLTRFDHRKEGADDDLFLKIECQKNKVIQEDGYGALFSDWGEKTLLTSYKSDTEQQQGDDSVEILNNLQKQWDEVITRQTFPDLKRIEAPMIGEAYMKTKIPADTILVYYYYGAYGDWRAAVYIFIFTREVSLLRISRVEDWSSSDVATVVDDKRVVLHRFALSVSQLRESLVQEPGPLVISQEAKLLLEKESRFYLGDSAKDILAHFRQVGKSHICFVPNGPLHYFPLHLILIDGKPLAENWTISCLPNLALIERESGTGALQTRGPSLVAFGLAASPHLKNILPDLDHGPAEAEAIAAAFQGIAYTGERATKNTFLLALNSATMVHLSAHGCMNIAAPSFQSIVLYPDADNDGIVYAWEVFEQDLRAVDLVTLSACETALGRFDIGDNLTGLPAYLLLGGVQTVIGALWEIEENAAFLFFTTLYGRLKAGKSKKKAFKEAQETTRRAFPQYRLWGGFYYMGV